MSRPAIPAWMDRAIWKRDKGACVDCGVKDVLLHRDHDPPWEIVKRHTVAGIFLRCVAHHKDKFKGDMKVIVKYRRLGNKFNAPRPENKMQGKGFDKTRTRGFDGRVRERKTRNGEG